MKHEIGEYFREEENQTIIDKHIIGKTVTPNEGRGKACVVNAGCDASGEYITAKFLGISYKIRKELFGHFKLID